MQNSVRFYPMESERELSHQFWKKRINGATYSAVCTKITPVFFSKDIYFLIKFQAISYTRNRDQLNRKIQ